MAKRKAHSRFWVFLYLASALAATAFYLILSKGLNFSLSEQYLSKEKLLSRAIAQNFETFFQTLGNSTAFQAQLSNKKYWDATTQKDLDEFVDQWRDSGLVAGVIIADAQGIVKINSNTRGDSDLGASVSDRDYFIWASGQIGRGKYFIGNPVVSKLGASKDQMIVPVASPIIIDGVFKGVLTTAVKLDPLTQRFIDKMKVTKSTSVYLINSLDKRIIYKSPESPELEEKVIDMIFLGETDSFRQNRQLIAYSTVDLDSQSWMLVVSSPITEIFSYSIPFYIRQIGVLIFIAITTLIFGIIAKQERQNKL